MLLKLMSRPFRPNGVFYDFNDYLNSRKVITKLILVDINGQCRITMLKGSF